MSISKAQAKAIADGFLDTLGTADEFSPEQSFTEIILLAAELVEDAQKNLIQSDSISSGKLSESLSVSEPTVNGKIFRVDIMMNDYGRYVNKGVKGTQISRGNSLYQFKNNKVSYNMVNAIQKWIKRSSMQVKNVKQASSTLERKRKSISQLNQGRSMAFAVAVSIKKMGILPTGFLDKAIISTQNKVANRLGAALKIDVITSITNT